MLFIVSICAVTSITFSIYIRYRLGLARMEIQYLNNKISDIAFSHEGQLEQLRLEKVDKDATLDRLRDQYKLEVEHMKDVNVCLEKKLSAFEVKNSLLMEELLDSKKEMKLQFESIAQRTLDNVACKMNERTQERLSGIVTPFRERIIELEKTIKDSFNNTSKEAFSLKSEIKNLSEASIRMSTKADDLTNALRFNKKQQGNWGESILEELLASSGLRKGIDYQIQKNISDTHNRMIPDVVVNLPEDKHIIIDAKTSMNSYVDYCSSHDAEKGREFLINMRKHVKDLSEKQYTSSGNLNALEFVLMFIPIEGAYILAMQKDSNLMNYAWEKKIAIVSPTTLFTTLKTIASLWKIDHQNKNTMEIARQGGALYDKFVGFIETMEKIGMSILKSQEQYEIAFKQLGSGSGNLVGRAEKLRELGVKTAKKLKIGDSND